MKPTLTEFCQICFFSSIYNWVEKFHEQKVFFTWFFVIPSEISHMKSPYCKNVRHARQREARNTRGNIVPRTNSDKPYIAVSWSMRVYRRACIRVRSRVCSGHSTFLLQYCVHAALRAIFARFYIFPAFPTIAPFTIDPGKACTENREEKLKGLLEQLHFLFIF